MRPSWKLTEVKNMERTEHVGSSTAKLIDISDKSAQQPRKKLQRKCALPIDPSA